MSIARLEREDQASHWPAMLAIAAACLALLVFAFHGALGSMVKGWEAEEYSHGYIIPFVALLIGWGLLAQRPPVVRPSFLGSAMIIAGFLMLVVGELATFMQLAQFGFLLAIVGLFESIMGGAALRLTAPAFIYLLFAVPLPTQMLSNMSAGMQIVSSDLGVLVLDALSVPVFQDGNIIDLGGYQLQVAEACSGLRYLFPLMSFGFLIAFLFEASWWKRILVFLSSAPIAIIMNSLRIAFIGITVDEWGIEAAEGLVHEFEGWVVFLFCTLFLLAEVWVLSQIGKRGRLRLELLSLPPALRLPHPRSGFGAASSALAISIAAAILVGAGAVGPRSEVIPVHRNLADFPLTIGDWHGHQGELEPDVLRRLALSDHFLADYTEPDSRNPMNFYIAYYDYQRMGSSAHSPSNCIPGGGWKVVDDSQKTIDVPSAGIGAGTEKLTIERMSIRLGDQRQVVYYWYAERGRDLTSPLVAKWYFFLDSIMRRRSDGALVRFVTLLSPGEDESLGDKRIEGFIAETMPKLREFLPAEFSMDDPIH